MLRRRSRRVLYARARHRQRGSPTGQRECLCIPERADHSGNYIDATAVPSLPTTYGWYGSIERAITEALFGGMDMYDVHSSTLVPNEYFDRFGVTPFDVLENLSP